MKDTENIKITIENNGSKAIFEVPFDFEISDWINLFKSILIFLTFSPDSLSEYFKDEE